MLFAKTLVEVAYDLVVGWDKKRIPTKSKTIGLMRNLTQKMLGFARAQPNLHYSSCELWLVGWDEGRIPTKR